MTVQVKRGDTHKVPFTATGAGVAVDLSGATLRLLASKGVDTVELAVVVEEAAAGRVSHQLTGTLPVGTWRVELEVTKDGVTTTFPNGSYLMLEVLPDLG